MLKDALRKEIPRKAFRESQLFEKNEAVDKSGHPVKKISFVDSSGQTVTGFYKKIDATYPALLAKNCVAMSVYMRTFLGDRCAEERLVFDDDGNIKGTVSIALPDFKPFLYNFDNAPENANEREKVNPSVKTLLKHNVAEWLAALWYMKEDDAHPGNSDLEGIIDCDMRKYPEQEIIKGPRTTDDPAHAVRELPLFGRLFSAMVSFLFSAKNTGATMALKEQDFNNFPIVYYRTHWPTNKFPGNANYGKRFQAYKAFRMLASNPSYITEDGKKITFQQQFFKALLKILVTYDPAMLKAQLKDYFDTDKQEMEVDYLSLEPEKCQKLGEYYWKLNNKGKHFDSQELSEFNKNYSKTSYVNHLLRTFQNDYDELYSKLIYYRGCVKNMKGARVPPFYEFLHTNPECFQEIEQWTASRNQKMEAARDQATPSDKIPVASAFASPEGQYNSEKLKQRYHQIWRDAHSQLVEDALLEAKILDEELSEGLNAVRPKSEMIAGLLQESFFTQSYQVFENYRSEEGTAKAPQKTSQIAAENNARDAGVAAIHQFREDFYQATSEYYKKQAGDNTLTVEDNGNFCAKVIRLAEELMQKVSRLFGKAAAWLDKIKELVGITRKLAVMMKPPAPEFGTQASPAEPIKFPFVGFKRREHTDPKIISYFLPQFFDWVKSFDKEIFNNYVLEEARKSRGNFAMRLFSSGNLEEDVGKLLKIHKELSNDLRLAQIFQNDKEEYKSLYTGLFISLLPAYLYSQQHVTAAMQSVKEAIEENKFQTELYVEQVVNYARTEKRFADVQKQDRKAEVHQAIYNYVDSLKLDEFRKIIVEIMAEYKKKTYGSRSKEINEALKTNQNNQRTLADLFAKGKPTSTFSQLLFAKLMDRMKRKYCANLSQEQSTEDYKLITGIPISEYSAYLATAQSFAEEFKAKNPIVSIAPIKKTPARIAAPSAQSFF
ncbi:hypothetical protein ACFORL_03755 [Legionella dresdenensis]|uniref:Uncharacterized protein n=1 Tax=Legionella dresdenensis TaxID=450200 RepID=A0ABV8CD16_9GAMM